jgi:hypothetical protein
MSSYVSFAVLLKLAENCMDILQNTPDAKGKDGVYSILLSNERKSVYCDMSTEGGGWTVSTQKLEITELTNNET